MKRYRFKTLEEFDKTCKRLENGSYITGNTKFVENMYHLLGMEINEEDSDRILQNLGYNITLTTNIAGDLDWKYCEEMITEITGQKTSFEKVITDFLLEGHSVDDVISEVTRVKNNLYTKISTEIENLSDEVEKRKEVLNRLK